jgi:hypothetical protein
MRNPGRTGERTGSAREKAGRGERERKIFRAAEGHRYFLQQQSGINWESKAANKPQSSADPGTKPAAPPGSANRALGAAASHKDSAGQEIAHGHGQVEAAPRGVGNRLAAGGSLVAFRFGAGSFSCRRRSFASRKRRRSDALPLHCRRNVGALEALSRAARHVI